jgi:hypothetical protein
MDYKKIYDDLMLKARSENRVKNVGVYYEAHHIIPRCLGGGGKVSQRTKHPNIILLTAKEHFVAHKLLCEIYPNNKKLLSAFWNFVNGRNKSNQGENHHRIGAREYERTRVYYSKRCSEFFKKIDRNKEWCKNISISHKKNNPMYGKKHTEDWKLKHSKRMSGSSHPMHGKKHSPESRKKQSDIKKGRYTGWDNPTGGVYMDVTNGIFYDINEILEITGKKSKGHICSMMSGKRRNKTNFIKV